MEKESEHIRDSFIFYRSFYEAIHELKDDIKLEVFTAITEYALYGKVPEGLKSVAKGMFTLIKPNLDVNTARYNNGRKGGRKPSAEKSPAFSPPMGQATAPAGLSSGENPASAGLSPGVNAFSSFEEEVAQIKTDQIWWELVCMQFHIGKAELDSRLDAFVTHCKIERDNELHPSLKEAKRHFTSWMRKAYPQKNTINDPKPQDKYAKRRGADSAALSPEDYTGEI